MYSPITSICYNEKNAYTYILCALISKINAVQFLPRYFRLLLSYMSLLSILTTLIIFPIFPKICGERILAFCCYVLATFWPYYSSSEHIYSSIVAVVWQPTSTIVVFYTFWLRFSSIYPNIDVSNRLVPYTSSRCMPYINERGVFLLYLLCVYIPGGNISSSSIFIAKMYFYLMDKSLLHFSIDLIIFHMNPRVE